MDRWINREAVDLENSWTINEEFGRYKYRHNYNDFRPKKEKKILKPVVEHEKVRLDIFSDCYHRFRTVFLSFKNEEEVFSTIK